MALVVLENTLKNPRLWTRKCQKQYFLKIHDFDSDSLKNNSQQILNYALIIFWKIKDYCFNSPWNIIIKKHYYFSDSSWDIILKNHVYYCDSFWDIILLNHDYFSESPWDIIFKNTIIALRVLEIKSLKNTIIILSVLET